MRKTSHHTRNKTMLYEMTDAEAFSTFNVDLGEFVEATNKHVRADQQIDPTPLYGQDMWNVRLARASKVDPSAMDADELNRCRKQERAERVERLAYLVSAMDKEQMESGDVSITDLIEPPIYA